MKNTTMTAVGKVAAGTPASGWLGDGRIVARHRALWPTRTPAAVHGWSPTLNHGSTEARALAFSFDSGGTDLIAEIEGRCARTRRPL